MTELVWEAHRRACAAGEHLYTDPVTGFQVFTEIGLSARERCCGSGCRHCPYQHIRIPLAQRPLRIQRPALLVGSLVEGTGYTAVPWKDCEGSRIALRSGQTQPLLVCPFDAFERRISSGEKLATLLHAASLQDEPVLGLPLPAGRSLPQVLQEAINDFPIVNLVRGDLSEAEWHAVRAIGLPILP